MISRDSNKMALICAFISVIGLFIMLVADSMGKAPHIEIQDVKQEMAGERVILCGDVKSKYDNGKDTVFLDIIGDNSSIRAVFFKDVKEIASEIKAKSEICIEGNIQVYRGEMELVARRLIDS